MFRPHIILMPGFIVLECYCLEEHPRLSENIAWERGLAGAFPPPVFFFSSFNRKQKVGPEAFGRKAD